MKKDLNHIAKSTSGLALLYAIVLISVIASILLVIVSLTLLGLNNSNQSERRTKVLDIAEAGINYYLWHLVHDPDDYCDGNACPGGSGPYGPYVHDFEDNTGTKIGTYTIWITPPSGDEGAVIVQSRGDVEGGSENRTIIAKLGIPSFAQYAVVSNDTVNHIRFGDGTEIFGPVHNNGGVRVDGVAHGLVSSALATYNDPDHSGGTEPGVHTHKSDPDLVFLGGTSYPVPSVDFSSITSDLNDLENEAQDDGVYYGPSGANGYHVTLKTNNTFDIYTVNSVTGSCWGGFWIGWVSTEGISGETPLALSVPFPANGILFLADKLWIDGQIDGANITIAAATLPADPSTDKSITINTDLKYTNYDGTDKIGLIAQKDITVGLFSEGSFTGTDDEKELRIDAALIAQNGRVGRNYYRKNCNSTYYQRNIVTVYGAVATSRRYGFTWICGNSWTENDACDSGYKDRNIIYDINLTANPPPNFPTIGNYAILDWREE